MDTPLSPHVLFFFNDTATTEIYTLSLHDALPISRQQLEMLHPGIKRAVNPHQYPADRKSTRLNSSHHRISYAVFCLKKKKGLNQRQDVIQDRKIMVYGGRRVGEH